MVGHTGQVQIGHEQVGHAERKNDLAIDSTLMS